MQRRCFDQLCVTNPVMIFSAGKVGSTSLRQPLFKIFEEDYEVVITEHRLPFSDYEHDYFLVIPFTKSDYLGYLFSRYVRGDVPCPGKGSETRLKIISPIREPIGRDVSAFFQGGLWEHLGFEVPEIPDNPQSIEFTLALSNQELRDIYLDFYGSCERGNCAMMRSITVWYEENLIPGLGIDVYARPFPKERVAYYTTHKADLMIYDCSLDDEKQESLIKDFLGIDTFTMQRTHVTSEKNVVVRQLYERFKQEIRFPEWYLETVFSSAYFRHFYTAQDEARLRRQWSEATPKRRDER